MKSLWGGVFLFLLSACSSAPSPVASVARDHQLISVQTPGVMGANCFVRVDGMSYPVATPGKVMVKPSREPMDVTCFKGEHMVGNQQVPPACPNCGYPENVSIAMALDIQSMERNVTIFRH